MKEDKSVTAEAVPVGKLIDFVDGKLRADKPEERVRQSILKRLINTLKFPRSRVYVEHPIKVGSSRKRLDIAIFDDSPGRDQSDIKIIIECKPEKVSPGDRKEGVEQLKSYLAASINCKWGMWTNGKHREVWEKVISPSGVYSFVERVDIPGPDGTVLEGIQRPELQKASGESLVFAFKSAHNNIHVVDGFQKEKAFFELLKIIFCKIADEKNIPHALEFFVKSEELVDPDGQHACATRIRRIFERVKLTYPQIFGPSDTIELQPRSLARIVSEIQFFSLLTSDIDIKGKAYEEVVGSNLKGDRGQFFTPRNVMKMAVEMLNPTISERTLDPACGTGGFLVSSMLQGLENLKEAFRGDYGDEINTWPHEVRSQFDARIADIARTSYFGFDISPELVRAAKMNMVMNNDGSGNMLQADSLLPPFRWSQHFRESLAKAVNSGAESVADKIDPERLTSAQDIALFDVILTNPPFGSKIVIRDQEVLEQYDLAHIWERLDDGWVKTSRLQSGVPPEQLFLERCIQFLVPGGRMAIVVPDSILGSPGLEYIRHWLFSKARIVASVDLPVETFLPNVGVQTSLLVIEKNPKPPADSSTYVPSDYEVFMAIVEHIGHDKRGNTRYARDEYGNEVLQEIEEKNPENKDSPVTLRKEKVIDDQTSLVAAAFDQWKQGEGIPW